MNTSLREAFTSPEFDGLVIQFWPATAGNLTRHATLLLAKAVKKVLNRSCDKWNIQTVSGLPTYFDLLPPPEENITVQQGFDLKNILKEEQPLQYVEVLLETNLDNIPETLEEEDEFESLASPWHKLTDTERDPLWNHKIVNTAVAWEHSRGEGIIVGHPDSGYIPHVELDDGRIRHDLEKNFYGKKPTPSAVNAEKRGGNHGLGTGSVLMSGLEQQSDTHYVTGIAPKAILVPLRITKKGAPIFFSRSGPRRVREAIRHAIEIGCHVISMSLGGPFEKSLHETIQEAVSKNIIVCAAAGNVVRIVVWPARYKEVIAVAACTADRKRWVHSSRGPTVDVTAPGHNVWRAYIDEFNNQSSEPGSGTSFAVPHVAGIAALWLAKHGRDFLLRKYQRVPLYMVFRKVLQDACDPAPEGDHENFGAGIVNAARTLEMPLPEENELVAQHMAETASDSFESAEPNQLDNFNKIFDLLPKQEVRERVAALLDTPESEVESRLQTLNVNELTYIIMTNPDLREYLTDPKIAQTEFDDAEGLESMSSELSPLLKGKMLHQNLLTLPLSTELRSQLENVSE